MIINEPVKELEISNFDYLEENFKKYISFAVSMKKIWKTSKNAGEEETEKVMKYQIKFIDSINFMKCSFSKLADNLSERNHQKI